MFPATTTTTIITTVIVTPDRSTEIAKTAALHRYITNGDLPSRVLTDRQTKEKRRSVGVAVCESVNAVLSETALYNDKTTPVI